MKVEGLENKNNELMVAVHEIRSRANNSGISSDRAEINEETIMLKKLNADLNRKNEQLMKREKELLEQLISKNQNKGSRVVTNQNNSHGKNLINENMKILNSTPKSESKKSRGGS